MTLLLAASIALPLFLAPMLYSSSRLSREAGRFAPWAAFPTLILALLPIEYPTLQLPWLVVGTWIDVDPIGRIFLIVSALLWTAAGVYAGSYVEPEGQRRFMLFFLPTLTGNLGLTVAGDAVSFYLFFALMTFAGYGLIAHRRDAEAKRAGRVYLVLAVAGEAFLLAGLLLGVAAADSTELAMIPVAVGASERVGVITLCLLLGFAIKAGAVPLHVWLPLAHPVAPTPASAVLSGSMIKAGLLGWIRFLPIGEVAQPGWGSIVIGMGIVAAFFGVIVGLVQLDSKTVLAYSSISQMGLMNVAIGIALAVPEAAAPALVALSFYVVHHGLAKGALFLGVGVAEAGGQSRFARALVLAGLVYAGFALAGAPLTSGNAAKSELKGLLALAPGGWPLWLEILLPLSAGATTLLICRFLVLTMPTRAVDTEHRFTFRLWGPWGGVILSSLVGIWILPRIFPIPGAEPASLPYFESIVLDLMPIAAAVVLYVLLAKWWHGWTRSPGRPRIEPGDILGPIERGLQAVPRPAALIEAVSDRGLVPGIARRWYRVFSESDRDDLLIRLEISLTRWPMALSLVLLLSAALLVLISQGTR